MHSILAARTDFSVGESILDPEKLVKHAKELGATAVAITDTMSVTGMIDFTTRAKKAEIKPIIGTRLRISASVSWRPGPGEKKRDLPPEYFVTVYALTEAGLKAIYRLLTLGNSEAPIDPANPDGPGRFYYTAKLGLDDLYAELDALGPGQLALHLGDTFSLLTHPDAKAVVARIVRAIGNEHTYTPLIPIDTPYFTTMNALALDAMHTSGLKPLVIRPAFYEKDNADAAELMAAIVNGNKVSDPWHKSTYNRDFHLVGVRDLVEQVKVAIGRLTARGIQSSAYFQDGLRNTQALVDAVGYVWDKQPVSLPQMAPDEFEAVKQACRVGWKRRFTDPTFGHLPSPQELKDVYAPRLAYELGVLKKLNFSGYFLLVEDVVQFAKSNGILVGPGRGSVGGSLVAYLMGITDCDPIRFGLLFERFINPDRIDLPDADLDFMSERRHEVVEYLVGKYGQARVAGVSNFGTLAAASTIGSVGKAFLIPEKDTRVSKLVPKLHGANVPLSKCAEQVAEIAAFAEEWPSVWPIMLRLEGTLRNFSQHAAGIVVGGVDLVERAVVERRKDASVVCWDKRIVEDQGLVKMDILGLSTLDLIALTLQYIKERHAGRRVDLMQIPLDDPKVLTNFAQGLTVGVFQFESGGMRRLLKELGADGTITFDDITAATALYRPGPMESGMMDSYYKRKQGLETVEYDHPLMEPILKPTFGVMVYQEQVMQVARTIAGYSAPGADKLRKIMGKKLPEEMAKERGKFVEGCVATIGCTEQWAGQLFDKIEGFAGYGFNKSHSVEYTLISYQSMWLKTYYPVEFYAAALSLQDEDKLPGLIRDASRFGVELRMPDINISTGRFEIATDTALVIPFQRIKGLSTNTVDAILTARQAGPFQDKADFIARVERRKCNVGHQTKLDQVGAFVRIEPGQPPSDDPSRIRDQIELLPGLVAANVPINRDMNTDDVSKRAIIDVVRAYRDLHGPDGEEMDGLPVKPNFGKNARFMIIQDAPGAQDEETGTMGWSQSISCVTDAMSDVDLSRNDAYWTALIKRPKAGKQVSPEEIATYADYLTKEIEILKPPVIALVGSQVVRHFFPDFKGKASDMAGKVIFSKELDANIVIGFSPGEIYFSPEKQTQMVEVFRSVAELLA